MAEKQVEQFSTREQDIMAKAWLCMDAEPRINYTQLAELCGFTNVRSASNAWSAIKKKLMAVANGGSATPKDKSAGEDGVSTPKSQTPSTKKRGRAVKGDADGTPSRKSRKVIKKEASPEPSPDHEDEAEAGEEGMQGENSAMDIKAEPGADKEDHDSEEELNKALLGESN